MSITQYDSKERGTIQNGSDMIECQFCEVKYIDVDLRGYCAACLDDFRERLNNGR